MGNTCAGLSGPISHRSHWGPQAGVEELWHCSQWPQVPVAGSGTGSPRARVGCAGVPRAGVPHSQADF